MLNKPVKLKSRSPTPADLSHLPLTTELGKFLKLYVRGQNQAIEAVCQQYAYFRSGLKEINERSRKRPICALLFLGPSGVGKTELGKRLAQFFHGTPKAASLIAMGDFSQPHEVAKFIGAPPGYIGHENPPVLSKEKLYAKIPGLQPPAPRGLDDFLTKVFLKERYEEYVYLRRQELDACLKEILLLDQTTHYYNLLLKQLEKEETSLGRRSPEYEKNKNFYRKLLECLYQRRTNLLVSYLATVEIMHEHKQDFRFAAVLYPETLLQEAEKRGKMTWPTVTDHLNAAASAPSGSLPDQRSSDSFAAEEPVLVIILDEIEKAHNTIFNFLLNVFEEGEVSFSNGESTSFHRTFFLLTSNLGARGISEILKKKDRTPGFITARKDKGISSAVNRELRVFPPEFLNRLDAIVIFNDLSDQTMTEILEMRLKELALDLEKKHSCLEIGTGVREALLEKTKTAPEAQARELQNQFDRWIIKPLALMLEHQSLEQKKLILKVDRKKITLILQPFPPA